MRFNSEAASKIEMMLVSVEGDQMMLSTFIENNQESLTAYDALNITSNLIADGIAYVALGNGDETKIIRLED